MADDVLVVDNSILSSVAKCPTQAFINYGLGLKTRAESLAMAAGSAIHLGLARWLSGAATKEALEVCASAYEKSVTRYLRKVELPRLGANDRRFEPEWIEGIFWQYLTRYEDNFPFKVVAETMEHPIQAPFPVTVPSGKEVVYVARLDAIVRKWESGGKWSMDHKTTKKVSEWWIEKEKISSQFSGQMWLGKQGVLQQDWDLQGVVVNAIEVPEPHRSEKICPTHKESYQKCSVRHAGGTFVYIQRGEREMEAWLHTAKKLTRQYDRLLTLAREEGAAAIDRVRMDGRFNGSCTFCEEREWCRLGRNVGKNAMRSMFIEEWWDPRVGQEA